MDLFGACIGAREQDGQGAGGGAEADARLPSSAARGGATGGSRLGDVLSLFGDHEQVSVQELGHHQQEARRAQHFQATHQSRAAGWWLQPPGPPMPTDNFSAAVPSLGPGPQPASRHRKNTDEKGSTTAARRSAPGSGSRAEITGRTAAGPVPPTSSRRWRCVVAKTIRNTSKAMSLARGSRRWTALAPRLQRSKTA